MGGWGGADGEGTVAVEEEVVWGGDGGGWGWGGGGVGSGGGELYFVEDVVVEVAEAHVAEGTRRCGVGRIVCGEELEDYYVGQALGEEGLAVVVRNVGGGVFVLAAGDLVHELERGDVGGGSRGGHCDGEEREVVALLGYFFMKVRTESGIDCFEYR